MENLDFKQKSFWQRKEGTVGMVGIGILLIGGGNLFYHLLPTLIVMAQNTLYLLGMIFVIALMLLPVFDKRTRTLISFGYKSFIRKLTSLFIQMDPIAVVEIHLSNLKEKVNEFNGQLEKFKSLQKLLDKKIEILEEKKEHSLLLSSEAKRLGREHDFALNVNNVGYAEEGISKLSKIKENANYISEILKRTKEATEFVVKDTENKIDIKKIEFEMAKQSASAIDSAMKILKGDLASADIYSNAMEYMADEIGFKLGKIDGFLETTGDILDTIDLEKGVMNNKGLASLENWEKQTLGKITQTLA